MDNKSQIKRRKKLIEVAIPLDEINEASAKEKSIRHGHPSTLHLWWASRPLAAARAIIFCQLVDDPSSIPELFPTAKSQNSERERLFLIIKRLVRWENLNNIDLLNEANTEIQKSWERCCKDNLNHPEASTKFNSKVIPSFHDPFAGGGAIPLEAQRLGLDSFASDLNPVAVLLNKALLEVPYLISNFESLKSSTEKLIVDNSSNQSNELIGDIRFYGKLLREKVKRKIGELYPDIKITLDMVDNREDLRPYLNQKLPIIGYIWARTVNSPDPAFTKIKVPLVSTFVLSQMRGKEVFIEPIVEDNSYKFLIKVGLPKNIKESKKGLKVKRGVFKCIMSGSIINSDYIRSEGEKGELGKKLMAIVVEGSNQRIYLEPIKTHEDLVDKSEAKWKPNFEFNKNALGFNVGNYGLQYWSDIFNERQLIALTTFFETIEEIEEIIKLDAKAKGLQDDNLPLSQNGKGVRAYAEAISLYLNLVCSSLADRMSTLCTWDSGGSTWGTKTRNTFSRQTISMTWDYFEVNPFSNQTGSFLNSLEYTTKAINSSPLKKGHVIQSNASNQFISQNKVISTDPPYYDNIGYADLSDYFYVWLRKGLKRIYPQLFATILVPKKDELVACPARHGGRNNAENFFLSGMTEAMSNLSNLSHKAFPLTIYYAFKQSEIKKDTGKISTGWETFISSVINSGLAIIGTWPLRTELANRMRSVNSNALATSIVLICETKNKNAPSISRAEFRKELNIKLPIAIENFQLAKIAPLDIAQAAIGPGMAIYSQVNHVYNPDDSIMTVGQALIEINFVLDEYFAKDAIEIDLDSLFALTFFESFGYSERPFDDAEGLAKARNVSVEGIVKSGILKSVGGKVNLIKRENLQQNWDPIKDERLCVWEATQYLIRTLEIEGEIAASKLLDTLKNISGFGDLATSCRSLAYRLYNHCEKNNQFEEAHSYNSLIISWSEIEKISADNNYESKIQTSLF